LDKQLTNHALGLNLREDLTFSLLALESGVTLAEAEAVLSGQANLLHGSREFTSVESSLETTLGKAERLTASARFGAIRQILTIDSYSDWPDAFILQWTFENTGDLPLAIDSLAAPRLKLDEPLREELWTMQGAAVKWGQDFAFPLPNRFERDNYLGHLQNGEGGGIPMIYAWTRTAGLTLAHIEPFQALWHLPVTADSHGVCLGLEDRNPQVLPPGQAIHSLRVLLSLHHGDFFAPLTLYRNIMACQGLAAPVPNKEDYAPAWCSWGYEFDVRPEEVVGVLPVLGDLDLHWLTLDDHWFDYYGDWNPRPESFPGGGDQMRLMVEKIHQAKGLAQIWWYPLCVEDGHGNWDGHPYGFSKLLRQHPDWLVLNSDGSVARNNRQLAMLCPALPEVQEYILKMVRLFIEEWGFDGHKLDNIYCMAPCNNPAHHHTRPEDSVEAFAGIYRQIHEETRRLRPHGVTQICPCGTPITHTLLPAVDQTVTGDPTSSAQIRQRIKFYKALTGPRMPVSADHIELSDGGTDFASEIGAGGIPATKFILPPDGTTRRRLKEYWPITPAKQALYKKWFTISQQNSLIDGETLNLYDLAFDRPEAHVIRKGTRLYFAFFTPHNSDMFRGRLELRGLEERSYHLHDYVDDHPLGTVHGPTGNLEIQFRGSLLFFATPEE
jgi:alpha-galactosidase